MKGFSTIAALGGPFIVVAAADTPRKLRGRADYICDGTRETGGDEVEINAALAAADTVVLCPGTYWVSGSIIMGSNKSLIGMGSGCTIKLKDYCNEDIFVITNLDYINGNSNIQISNINIDGNRENQSTDYFHSGIYFEKVTNSKITRCRIEKHIGDGIDMINSSNNTITDNIISGNEFDGIYMINSNGNVISSNMISGNEGDGIYMHTGNNDNVVSNNIISGNEDIGIYIDAGNRNTVAYNIISGNGDDGIICESSFSILTSNIISGNKDGILIVDSINVAITSNIVAGNTGYGIFLAFCYNSVINDNAIINNGWWGIYIGKSDNNIISKNMISGNGRVSSNEQSGITLDDSDYNLISGNVLRHGGYQKYGIEISNSLCNYNMVEGNNLYASGLTGDLYNAGSNTRRRDNLGNTGAWLTDA